MSDRELVVLGTASQAPTRSGNHNGYLLLWDGEGLLFDPKARPAITQSHLPHNAESPPAGRSPGLRALVIPGPALFCAPANGW